LRIAAGQPRFLARHIARLRDGANALHLGKVAEATIRRAVAELGEAALPDGEGAVRLQISRDGDGTTHLVGSARELGKDPTEWSAVIFERPHDGASLVDGIKVSSRLTLSLAAEAARAAGVDEAVLLDATGQLVEGANSNLFVASREGTVATPPTTTGAVAGIARGLALERIPEIEVRAIPKPELLAAAELIAVNAVRGARAITRLNGRRVGNGQPGPWSRRLAEALAKDE
jgi:branched-subunit amino acid aminotransferase/4-amino-4-deoxychorismate lyase